MRLLGADVGLHPRVGPAYPPPAIPTPACPRHVVLIFLNEYAGNTYEVANVDARGLILGMQRQLPQTLGGEWPARCSLIFVVGMSGFCVALLLVGSP